MARGFGRAVADVPPPSAIVAAPAAPATAAPATAPMPGTAEPARKASRAAAIDDADDQRSAGSVASALRSNASRSGGIPDRTADGSGGGPAGRGIPTADDQTPPNGPPASNCVDMLHQHGAVM